MNHFKANNIFTYNKIKIMKEIKKNKSLQFLANCTNFLTCIRAINFFTFPLFALPLLNPNDFSNSISSLSSFLNISNFILIRCTRYKNILIFN